MPCGDDRAERDHRIIERVACQYVKLLERSGLPVPAFAEPWWRDHKAYDARHGRNDPLPPYQVRLQDSDDEARMLMAIRYTLYARLHGYAAGGDIEIMRLVDEIVRKERHAPEV